MDPLRMHAYKAQAIKKHKAQQLLNDFILYSLTTLACTSFCSSPLCKVLFIVLNLIVIFLLGESKFFASMSKAYNDVYHNKYECKHLDQLQVVTPSKDGPKQKMQVEIFDSKTCEENDHEEFFELCNDEETCESRVDQMVESCGNVEDELSCSEQEEKVVEEGKREGSGGDGDVSLPAEEFNKLVDDFIAKIKRQRTLEDEFGRC
ncbi:hypothetical protein HanIR_Chr08g0381761 [Helianthus annuus]|nr:hypothetical protein HanIR_Chr08g0381761 [Helianthus annuus]